MSASKSSKSIAEYPDAVRRIVESDVPDDATTKQEVMSALINSGPQVTSEVAEDMMDSIITEDSVISAVESSGEIPTEGELDAIVDIADEYDLSRADTVREAVGNTIATVEEFDAAIDERATQDGPLFREQIETAVEDVASRQQVVGGSPDDVVASESIERGAPTEQNYRRARTQMILSGDQRSPRDVLGDSATEFDGVGDASAGQPASLIRDASGDPVGLTGAPTSEVGERMASELGTEYLTREDVDASLDLRQSAGNATLTLRDREISEVDL